MGTTFTSTATYSNLTRLELEQIRRADFWTSSKALTVGDAANGSEGVVGKGDLNAEPFYTGPEMPLDSVFTNTPPTAPGKSLSTLTAVSGVPTESVSWIGPELLYDSDVGIASTTSIWHDGTPGLNFALFVQVGDLLLIKSCANGSSGGNDWTVATVYFVGDSYVRVDHINNPTGPTSTELTAEGPSVPYNYVLVRPSAVQLFAVPGSGPTGREQTFMMVMPGSTLHSTVGPTTDQINADRLTNIVPPHYSHSTSIDRADGVFGSPAPRASLDKLGYRVVLYPSLVSDGGPDLAHPIATLNPIIDSSIPTADQRMAIDYQAGIVRFSCAPGTGGEVKPAGGCVSGTTGRLNLYAVYWVVDTALTKGSARGLWATRSDNTQTRHPGTVTFDLTNNCWRMSSNVTGHSFYVKALDTVETGEVLNSVEFGAYDAEDTSDKNRYFKYRSRSQTWMFKRNRNVDSDASSELVVADKTALTMGDGANPAVSPGGDAVPDTVFLPGATKGYRHTRETLDDLLKNASIKGYGTVHLRNGRYLLDGPINMPPGVTLEGEGAGTVLEGFTKPSNPVIHFGPNTPWGVYDFSWREGSAGVYPTGFELTDIYTKVEGQDLVWNPNKRMWGFVWADTSSHEIWFNEMDTAGKFLHAGYGLPLKNDATHLFTNASVNSGTHTSGHYPRIAYQPFLDMYGVVWVEEAAVGAPRLGAKFFASPAKDATVVEPTSYVGDATNMKDHPSIAFDPKDPMGWAAYISSSGVTSGGAKTIDIHTFSIAGLYSFSQSLTSSTAVVTSTDIGVNDAGEALVVWSEQTHPLITGGAGSISTGSTLSELRDSTCTFSTLGVAPGSKFHHLNVAGTSPVTDGGLDGYVTEVHPTYVQIKREDSPDALWTPFTPSVGHALLWAISPSSRIKSSRLSSGAMTSSVSVVHNGVGTPSKFRAEMREPDMVRMSESSDGRWLVVFQAFNSTAYLARTSMRNFDNGVSSSFVDSSEVPCLSPYVYREHVGTCAVLISANGLTVEPKPETSPSTLTLDGTVENTYALCRLANVMSKSLGSSDPLMSRPNAAWLNISMGTSPHSTPWGVKRGYHLDVSARHVMHKWTSEKPVALIPDLTWTGEDWTVVSPTQKQLFSDTGYIVNYLGVSYLVDETFYFGTGTKNAIDGNYLVPTASGYVYFPSLDTVVRYTVISEHCVQLDSVLLDGATSWYAVGFDQGGIHTDAGLKNLLFRVASNGKLIQGSSRLTDAMSHTWGNDYVPSTKVETVSRRRVYSQFTSPISSGGANDPMAYGTLKPYSTIDPAVPTGIGYNMNYPTSRISGDIGYVGAAAGMPKGYSYYPDEAPFVAIAWGESFYALADRLLGDGNNIAIFRQSAGPFRSTVRNVRLEGKSFRNDNAWGTPALLNIESRKHVLTRWGYPATGTGGFATDGYRMCFVYPTQRFLPAGYANPKASFGYVDSVSGVMYHTISWNATYTNAIGEGPVEYQGPESLVGWSDAAVGILKGTPTAFPLGDATAADTGTDPYPGARHQYHNPSSPTVIWNGTNYVAFWTEEIKDLASVTGGLICMGMYPGGEETKSLDGSVSSHRDTMRPQISAIAKVSCGQGLGDGVTGSGVGSLGQIDQGQIYVCDAAFSGKFYAVAWVAGLHPKAGTSGSDYRSGSAVGVTIFHAAAGGAGQTFLIDVATTGSNFVSPKIVWDGHDFVLFWASSGARLRRQIIPESGLGQPIQVLGMSAPDTQRTGGSHSIGILHGDNVGDSTAWIDTSPFGGIPCQPGDTIHIESTIYRLDCQLAGGGVSASMGVDAHGGYLEDVLSPFMPPLPGPPFPFSAGATVEITAPSSVQGRYVVTGVGSASRLHLNFHPPELVPSGVTYIVYQPEVSNALSGWYTVRNYDPVSSRIYLTTGNIGLTAESGLPVEPAGREVIGAIFSMGVNGESRLTRIGTGPGADHFTLPGSATSTDARYVAKDALFESPTDPARILSVAYNDLEDAYAILYIDTAKDIYVHTFSRRDFNPLTRVRVSSSTDARHGTMAWNGRNYLVIYTTDGGTFDKHHIRYALLSSSLSVEEAGDLVQHDNVFEPDYKKFLCGNGYGQIPGPLYSTYISNSVQTWTDIVPANGAMQARPQKLNLKWNDRLGRWVLSVGVLWGMNRGTVDTEDTEDSLWWITSPSPLSPYFSNPVTGYSGRTLTGSFPVPMIQPGMRLAFWDIATYRFAVVMTVMGVGPTTTGALSDDYSEIYVDVDSSELTADDIAVVTHVAGAGETHPSTWAIGREDIHVWTISTGTPTVEVIDADSCSLEGVDIGGSVDISEFYSMAARPTWRSTGAMVGAMLDVTNPTGANQVRPYTRSFLNPVGKIETVRLTNVRSRTAVKYGTGTDPADPVTGGQKSTFRSRRS